MNDTFEIPVTYKNNELSFNGKYLKFGYTHKFLVEVDGNTISFEPDEEGKYRATVDPLLHNIKTDTGLLKEIADTLNALI